MKTVFVSHPYAADPAGNFAKADKICKELADKGILSISPLHSFSYTDDTHRSEVLRACRRMIEFVDEVWVFGDSAGCRMEAAHAKELGIPVVYMYKRERGEGVA